METLRLFCDVARLQSFSLAAEQHDLTQSAVSQRIGALEKKLNARLIDRSVRPLALTPAGELLLREAIDILERYDRLAQSVSAIQQGPSGRIEVDAIYSAGIDLLKQTKEAFEQQHPRVSVDIRYKRPDEVYDAVRHDRCDLGILSYPQRWRDVGVIPLRDEVMVVVCRAGHALTARPRVHASELDSWPMITFEASLPVGRRIRKYLRDHDSDPRIVSVFDNIDTITSALAVTDNFAILPRRTVRRQVDAGTLAMAPLEPQLLRPLGIIYHRRPGAQRQFGPAAGAFVDFLLKHAGPVVDDATNSATPATALASQK